MDTPIEYELNTDCTLPAIVASLACLLARGISCVEVAVGLIDPIPILVRRNVLKGNLIQLSPSQVGQLVPSEFSIFTTGIVNLALTKSVFVPHEETYGYAGLDPKDVVHSAGNFRVAAHVRPQI